MVILNERALVGNMLQLICYDILHLKLNCLLGGNCDVENRCLTTDYGWVQVTKFLV